MPPKGRGRPSKRARNITGLCNQARALSPLPEQTNEQWAQAVQEMVMKHDLHREEEGDISCDESEQSDWEDLQDEEVANVFVKTAREEVLDGDDPVGDPDWIPQSVKDT